MPNVLIKKWCLGSSNSFAHNLSFCPKSVDQGVQLKNKRKYKESKSESCEEEFSIVWEDEPKAEYSQEGYNKGFKQGFLRHLSCCGIILFDGSDKYSIHSRNDYLRDYHDDTKYHWVGIGFGHGYRLLFSCFMIWFLCL